MPMSHSRVRLPGGGAWDAGRFADQCGDRTALVAFAILFDRVTRQAREIRVLRGLLPVCGFFKKIRKEDQNLGSQSNPTLPNGPRPASLIRFARSAQNSITVSITTR